ncbi:hypothetical protein [Halovenus sp. HT40]|uniref:hypothetical protein n=1 Tax=Halovenus sp. HT40 TaxID=3126691 RepID=UPI00300E9A3D
MTDIPRPDETIPEFLVEGFETESPRTLKAIAECAEDRTKTRGVPEYVRDGFALQDDETKAASAEYARNLAAFLEAEGYDTLEAVPREAYRDPSEVSSGSIGVGDLGPERRAYRDADTASGGDSDDDGGRFFGLF